MTRIFISYARNDGSDIAETLAKRLRSMEHEVFYDVESIRAGTRWEQELRERIKWSNLIVVIVTSGSNDSDWVFKEVKYGEESGKNILPVQVGNTALPVHLRGTWHAIKIADENDIDKVVVEVLHHVNRQPVSKPSIRLYLVIAVFLAILIVAGIVVIPKLNPQKEIDPTQSAPSLTATPSKAPLTILYREDFEDGVANDLRFDIDGEWKVNSIDGDNKALNSITTDADWSTVWFGKEEWQDYKLEFKLKPIKFGDSETARIVFRDQEAAGRYILIMHPNGSGLWKSVNNTWVSQEEFDAPDISTPLVLNEWNVVVIEVKGNQIKVSLNGNNSIDISDQPDPSLRGPIALVTSPNAELWFDDIVVTQL